MHGSFAPSNIGLSSHGAGRLADQAACQKARPGIQGAHDHDFPSFCSPITIETTGVFGEQSMAFIQDLSRQIRDTSGEVDEFSRLCQRISICIQRCNSAAIWGLFTLATLTVMMKTVFQLLGFSTLCLASLFPKCIKIPLSSQLAALAEPL